LTQLKRAGFTTIQLLHYYTVVIIAQYLHILRTSLPICALTKAHSKQLPKGLFQGSQQLEVKSQDQIFRKFQDTFVGFTRLKTQKMHVFLCA